LIADLEQAFDLASHPHVVNVRSVRRKDTADDEATLGLPTANGGGGKGGGGAAGDAAVGGAGATPDATGTPTGSPAHLEDVAAVARAECLRLQGVNRVLRERLAEVEASAAELEAARRAALGGVAPPPPRAQPPPPVPLFGGAGGATALALALGVVALAVAVAGLGRRRVV